MAIPFAFIAGVTGQNAWINEFHYDNTGTDVGEFIEVVIEDQGSYLLSDFSLTLYNGNNGGSYDTRTLNLYTAGVTVNNFQILWFNYTAAGGSIQNGAPDGLALSYQNTLIPGQFLSYEGTFVATDGPAIGQLSVDVGVEETSSTPVGQSLQLAGAGTTYGAFVWMPPAPHTAGDVNNNQNLGGTPDPEPTNYPTEFSADPAPFAIDLSWIDAVGGQLPFAYLIKASDQDNITLPVDGTPVADDPDLSDGTGVLNIAQGIEAATFSGLPANITYYFKIFPYTNAGTAIDYKTDGTPPSASATTPDLVIINYENFNDSTLGTWIAHNIIGQQQFWLIDSIHGIAGSPCAKMSGYSGGAVENEDWLISPAMNFDTYINEQLTFQTACNYDGPDLEVKISNEYDGVGNPNEFEWVDLSGTLSPGGWIWTPSGVVDVSGITGNSVYVGFKYTSTSSEAKTWEVDEILITGEVVIGISDPTKKNYPFRFFPNPAREQVTLTFPDSDEKVVSLLSILGLEVKNERITGNTCSISCTDLPPGVYFIRITGAGGETGVKKLIKE